MYSGKGIGQQLFFFPIYPIPIIYEHLYQFIQLTCKTESSYTEKQLHKIISHRYTKLLQRYSSFTQQRFFTRTRRDSVSAFSVPRWHSGQNCLRRSLSFLWWWRCRTLKQLYPSFVTVLQPMKTIVEDWKFDQETASPTEPSKISIAARREMWLQAVWGFPGTFECQACTSGFLIHSVR